MRKARITRKVFKYLFVTVYMIAALAAGHFSSLTLGHFFGDLLAIGLLLALIAVERFTAFIDYTLPDAVVRPALKVFRIDFQCTDP